jgi:uncharacterized protein (DUF2236 family)
MTAPPQPRRDALREELLTAFSGTPDGLPTWIRELAEGDDEGFFGPGSAAWAVHGSMGTLVAGIRALLMQALHPGAMAGVHDWSRYRQDPLGRLVGTVRWIVCVTFGSTDQAQRETARVTRYHERVAGEYESNDGAARPYAAADPDLLRWVHLAFTDAFLGSHLEWGGAIPGGPDAYVRDWATAGELMGVADPPRSLAGLRKQLAGYRGQLRRDERVDDVVRFIRRPPLSPRLRRAYGVLFAGAVASMPVEYRRLLGLRRSPLPVKWFTGIALRGAGSALGRGPGSADIAMERVKRLRATSAG